MLLDEMFDLNLVHATPRRAHKLLISRGWEPTTVPREYRNPDAPEYSIDLDMNSYAGKGPFVLYHHDRKVAQVSYPPYASHLMAGQYVRQHRN
jgi:hypothetical protein